MTVDHYQAEIVRDMFNKIISGWSIMGITTYMRENYDGKWTHVKVKRILENITYIGKVKYRNEIFEGNTHLFYLKNYFTKLKKPWKKEQTKR